MPMEVGAFEAKTQLSKLLELARRGERIIITKRGIPVAQLTAVDGRNVQDTRKAIEEIKAIRGRSKPGAESIRSLIEEGRRF
ncbi:MAG: type II toxin-antitoxin system Phd/YefM family antitoxin [Syntrophobacteraceae bacterium]